MSFVIKNFVNPFSLLVVYEMNENSDFYLDKISLNKNELLELEKYTFERRRKEWLCTRMVINEVMNSTMHILYNENGKPFIQNSDFKLSITHSKNLIGIIISKFQHVGIDIEQISNKVEKVLDKFLCKSEIEQVRTEKIKTYSLYWCAKEVLLKIYGIRDLDFIRCIRIFPFELQENGQFSGAIIHRDFHHVFKLNYFFINDFAIVWSLA